MADSKWLEPGDQTINTPRIRDVSRRIKGDGLQYVENALLWVNQNIRVERDRPDWEKIFRNRIADQIIKDGFSTGCTDTALVFTSILRAKQIPVKYVEVINKDWLESKTPNNSIEGHVFAEVQINNKWVVVDPEGMKITEEKTYKHHKVFAKGLDSWDIGIKSFEDLKNAFLRFKSPDYRSQG
ncbi:hypothetical protein A2115_03660 [Candidatus Woesebacteria bacterium GWA1_41_8]|uniref:Transglutaminase-like domain-containing protein n=1 Tax=Candidatus Woesebacteria bacterium GWA1_41_8 TaxID=1802471 RepID=A0A1F7WH47_9BACT|nr:MAG: hypothetical protein A2115_03660 [Candidatus Woesebacteria bacterium GWA1_41_8]